MPHIRIEYNSDLSFPSDSTLLNRLQDVLAEALPAKIESFKSRAIPCPTYRVGQGMPGSGFVHCEVRVMPGRTKETLERAAQEVLDILYEVFLPLHPGIGLSVEIAELGPAYVKRDAL